MLDTATLLYHQNAMLVASSASLAGALALAAQQAVNEMAEKPTVTIAVATTQTIDGARERRRRDDGAARR